MKTKGMKFQKKLLKQLRSGDKWAYTALLDLCEGNGLDDVCYMLRDVSKDWYNTELRIYKEDK